MYYFSGDLENDCFVMFNYLEELPLFGARNRMALNTIPKKPLSNVYGLTHFPRIVSWQNGSITYREKNPNGSGYFTKLRSMFPHFQEMFEEFIDLHRGGFKFTHVVINKNFKIKKHTDGNNIGVSCIIGIGDYEGGDLMIERDGKIEQHNIQNKFLTFNGSIYPHWVEDFTGDRYTLVFYNNDNQ